ncbi:fumarylacetoacetate hydrolase family protein [Nocardioides sp. L-11A]|uniref:fumarylacetoacetate hydrolase family protein n=1 Tax=Nocardioides sp. L-11A TaxID=3043848 RepID=UPI00249B3AA4|nr:fumarylacetoacetate hydrolase family protein [Nocardioides sp. L-11A]
MTGESVLVAGQGRDTHLHPISSVARDARLPEPARAELDQLIDTESWLVLSDDTTTALARLACDLAASGTTGLGRAEDLGPLAAALPTPTSRVFAMGGNYAHHMAQMTSRSPRRRTVQEVLDGGRAGDPWGYLVAPGTLTGSGEPVVPPRGALHLDYEAEAALIVASTGRDLSPDDVRFSGVTGYSDFTLRDKFEGSGLSLDQGPLSWSLVKNFESGKVLGPWAVLGDRTGPPPRVRGRVNGERRQDSAGDVLVQEPQVAIAYLSRFLTIRPGDVIACGCPAGTAADAGHPYLRPGDVVEVEVDGVGVLCNTINEWRNDDE